MLDRFGTGLKDAVKKLAGKSVIDKAAVDELVRDLQRVLIQSDVNVKLVMELTNTIKKRSLDEEPPKGMGAREHVLRIVYEELVHLMGEEVEVKLESQTILMAGLQGSGKTTTTGKLARFFQRKGLRVGVICADVFRPGAYDQLSTLCQKVNVPCYGEPGETDAVGIVTPRNERTVRHRSADHRYAGQACTRGCSHRRDHCTQRAFGSNTSLARYRCRTRPAAREQARRFHEAIDIDGVIITKMDGTAKGGGALSAVAETESGIVFVGSGETIEDLERFDPDGFISRLLGMGDLRALIERAEDAISPEDVDVNAMLKGKFTLRDMYKQLEALKKMGPLKQVMGMLPLGNVDLPQDAFDVTSVKMDRFKYIMDSMTNEELDNPGVISGSRIQRISVGSGTSPDEVRELIKYYKTMQRTLKTMRGGQGKFNMQRMMKKFGGM